MFTLVIQTGLRISELIGLSVTNIHTGVDAHVQCIGKGAKNAGPLLPATLAILSRWITERRGPADAPLLTSTTWRPLSRDAI